MIGFCEIVRCSIDIEEEIESWIYIYKYHLWSESVGKRNNKIGPEGGSNHRRRGWIVFKFQMPLEKATWPDIIGYPDVPVESQVLRGYRFTRITSWKATRNKLFSSGYNNSPPSSSPSCSTLFDYVQVYIDRQQVFQY